MASVFITTKMTTLCHGPGQQAESVDPDRYVPALLELWPQGPLWSRELDTDHAKFNRVIGQEWSRVDHRAQQLLKEGSPRTAVELLDRWEEVLGLPDTSSAATDIESRQRAAWEKYTSLGGQSPDFFIELAAKLDYEAVIERGTAMAFEVGVAELALQELGHPSHYWILHTRHGANDAQLEAAVARFSHLGFVATVLYDLP